MTVILNIKNNERETVIRDKDNNRIRSGERNNYVRKEERNVGGGDSAPLTPINTLHHTTHSSLTTIVKAIPIKTIVIDYFYKSCYIVAQLFSAILFHNVIFYSLIVFTTSQNI